MTVTVTWHTVVSVNVETKTAAQIAVHDFAAELLNPSLVEVIFTDRYEQVAGEYGAKALHQNHSGPTRQYVATKPDGALAVAKTIEVTAEKIVVVVVVSVGLLYNADMARRTLVHEAQHVRLIQNGDSAFAIHRRFDFILPSGLVWEFLWVAESALDEFRCERSVYERGLAKLDPDSGSVPQDHAVIQTAFAQVRRDYLRTNDLMRAYQEAFSVLDRLAVYLVYGAATLSIGSDKSKWVRVPGMAMVQQVLLDVPGTSVKLDIDQVVVISVELGRVLRTLLQSAGFDLFYMPDGGSYFKILT